LRRRYIPETTYTMAAAHASVTLAQQILGHRTDMSAHYLDPRLLPQRGAAEVLPVPQISADFRQLRLF
jgi:hypothetical protein